MSQFNCSLCGSAVIDELFDLQKTFTTASRTNLLNFVQTIISEDFFTNNYLICKICFHLLDELDTIRLKAKNIEDKLKRYVCQNRIKDQRGKNIDDCLKNEFESNIDFNDNSSLSELNPSLEDINILVPEERSSNNDNIPKKRKTNNLKPHSCTECQKTWKTLSELKNHLLSHNTEKPYICEICGQAYKRQQALTIHVGMHKGINPFTCIYCKKSFTQKGALVRHIPIHTGELPFQCDLCGKRFVHHTSFNIHKLSHSGKKSHKCEVCGLLLISGSHLKRHMRVHTGEKRFNCNTCGKKFAEKYNLVVHEKLHLGVSKKKKLH